MVTRHALNARLAERTIVGPDCTLLAFELPPVKVAFSPCQFAMLSARGTATPNALLGRAYSIVSWTSSAYSTKMEFLIRRAGTVSSFWLEAPLGTPASILAPLGNGLDPGSLAPHTALLAGGVGIAPLLPILEYLHSPAQLVLLFGARTADGLYLLDRVRRATERTGGTILEATEDGSMGFRGTVTDLLSRQIRSGQFAEVIACGPAGMLAETHKICRGAGVRLKAVMEGPMACGLGLCLGCALPLKAGGYLKLCVDGPVVDADLIDWEAMSWWT